LATGTTAVSAVLIPGSTVADANALRRKMPAEMRSSADAVT
jgi:hypothetical protein